ncbi:CinA family protein [Nitrosophilus kaiyonis]|uniref:CinA family protein n=1 Tax=Nitrosophilus kaiyonis TaxID=2930200 RepID=UPI0024929B42|nr:CinA family protein [Nitrosophilus kaiyonis]
MKNILIIVGKDIKINEPFIEYLKREACKKVGKIDAHINISENDKNLFLEISENFKKYDNLLIATSQTSFATVSKIVATLFDDILIAKDDILVPSKSSKYEKNSFLISENEKNVNVIKIKEIDKLPSIFLETKFEYAVLNIFNIDINEAKDKLSNLANTYDINLTFTYLTKEWIKVVAINSKFGDLAMFVQNAKLLLPENIVVAENIFEYLIERLSAIHKTVTFAESCTGGLLASMLTKVPGSSSIFKGSLVTYANEIKSSWLGVKPEILNEFGAVSKETVTGMLKGALKVSESDFAMAISGIAGPGGATPTKPVGTVVIGAKSNEKEIIKTMHFEGDRNYIQYQAAMYAVKLLFDIAKNELF